MIEPAASQKDSRRRWIAGCIALLVVVILQWVSNSRLREENVSLRSQQLAADSKPAYAQALPGAAEAIATDQLQRDKLELRQLRDELQRFREQPSAPGASAQPGSPPPAPAIAPAGQPPADEARQLALAAMRTMNPDEQVAIRSSIQSAFEMLGTEAGTGNTGSLRALWQASRIAELKGYAVKGLGQAAGLGNEEALEPLLEPEKYLLLRSSATSALKPAADAGNDRAIQALAATAADPKQEGLWLLAAQGLEKAAASGDATAIDSLATLAAVQNEVIRKQAVFALEAAARENQPRAEEALRKLGWR
jgi:hypothetical protein